MKNSQKKSRKLLKIAYNIDTYKDVLKNQPYG